MRLVLLSDYLPPERTGGAEKVVWQLGLALSQAGHEVHIITTTLKATFEEHQENFSTYHLHSAYPRRFQAWFGLFNPQLLGSLKRLLERIKPDVINAHNIHNEISYYSLVIAHRLKIPVVFTAHDVMSVSATKLTHFIKAGGVSSPNDYRLPPFYNLKMLRLRYNPLFYPSVRYLLRHYTQLRTTVSNANRAALEANGLPLFSVVYNGIDAASFVSTPDQIDQLRQRLSLQNQRVILFSGRASREKGIQQLFSALIQVIQQVPNVTLLVLTTAKIDPQQYSDPRIRQVIEQHVRQGGWLSGEELIAAYHLAELVIVPSIYADPFPTVNLEGMAAGKPMISTCFGGSSEIVLDGETGFIVNPLDIHQFSDRIMQILLNPDLGERLGQAGRQRVIEEFTLLGQTTQMINIYEQAIAMQRKVTSN